MSMSQRKLHSLVESWVNVVVGVGVSLAANATILPWMGFTITLEQNLQIAAIFTVISVVRSYLLRRAFNHWHVKYHTKRLTNSK